MGPLKERLFSSVVTYLQTQPQNRTLFTSLNHPISGSHLVRNAWAELKNNGRNEGIKKATGLQAILQERLDLFAFTNTDRGHLLIGLTDAAKTLDVADGIPASVGPPAPLPEKQTTDLIDNVSDPFNLITTESDAVDGLAGDGLAGNGEFVAALTPGRVGGVRGTEEAGLLEERAQKVAKLEKSKGKGKAAAADPNKPVWGFNGWQDIVWTPMLAIKREMERQKTNALVRALYKAVEMHAGSGVTLSQLGSDFKVAELKKDNSFKNWRLLDILKDYEDVFEIMAAQGVTGGMIVKLQPGAAAALPDAEEAANHVDEDEMALPERIENPRSAREKLQSLRIELVHALTRRGGKTAIQELGQEPQVQSKKKLLHQARKLIDYVKMFQDNFIITMGESEDKQFMVELVSTDVSNERMIDSFLQKDRDQSGVQKGKGKAGNDRGANDRRDRDRRDDRERDRDRRDDRFGQSGYGGSSASSVPPLVHAYPQPAYYPGYAYPPATYAAPQYYQQYAAPPPQPTQSVPHAYSAAPGYSTNGYAPPPAPPGGASGYAPPPSGASSYAPPPSGGPLGGGYAAPPAPPSGASAYAPPLAPPSGASAYAPPPAPPSGGGAYAPPPSEASAYAPPPSGASCAYAPLPSGVPPPRGPPAGSAPPPSSASYGSGGQQQPSAGYGYPAHSGYPALPAQPAQGYPAQPAQPLQYPYTQ